MTELNERIFLGKANEGMESLVGVPLQELATKEKIDLPSSIFLFACGAIDRTSLDFCERLAIFQAGERGVKIEKKCVGAETDFKRKEQETYVFWPWESIYKRYFAHPVSVLFHTHPQYTCDYLDSRSVTGITEPTLGHFNLEQTAAILNTGVPGFSCQDLKLFENHSRYIRSMLLGSAFGYRWVINPKRGIPLTDFSRKSKSYEEESNRLAMLEMERLAREGSSQIDFVAFQEKTDELLSVFCKEKGLVAFGNRNYRSPVLKRI